MEGWIYNKILDPLIMGRLPHPLTSYINPGESVIDIGSGTGSMALELAQSASWVTGLDLSPGMTRFAEKRRKGMGVENADFINGDATNLANHVTRTYDYALLSLMLHSISPERRKTIMDALGSIVKKFIIIDYISPMESRRAKGIVTAIERIAGGEHWQGYKNWMDNGALDGFAREQGLACIKSDIMISGFSKIAVFE